VGEHEVVTPKGQISSTFYLLAQGAVGLHDDVETPFTTPVRCPKWKCGGMVAAWSYYTALKGSGNTHVHQCGGSRGERCPHASERTTPGLWGLGRF